MTASPCEVGAPPQATLRSLLEGVEQQLQAAVAGKRGPSPTLRLGNCPTVRALVEGFHLSAFETQIVLLGVAMELQPAVPSLCAEIAQRADARFPTFRIALAALSGAHWDAILPDSPLRRYRLVHLGEGPLLTERPIHVNERVLHALLGCADFDPRVARRVHPLPTTRAPAEGEAMQFSGVLAAWAAEPPLRVHLQTSRVGDATSWVGRAAQHEGRRAVQISPTDVPMDLAELDELAALYNREARLSPLVLLMDLDDRVEVAQQRAGRELLERVEGAVVALSRDPMVERRQPWLRLSLPETGFRERRAAWSAVTKGTAAMTDAELDDLAARFELGAAQIEQLASNLQSPSGKSPKQALWDACRALARPNLEDLAQRVALDKTRPERLVLPASQLRMLDALVAQVRHKATVQHHWGMTQSGARGAGTSAVFSGPSGTGKTLAAEVLAARLGLDLYRIDLSAVVSKYIGETEKNLRRVFDAAEAGGAVLLFDEADALFGKRTEVQDSHDRHANIEVSYLLQRMEAYGGLAILTTNFRSAIDDAFLRRIQFLVDFPFPDAPLRARIWRGIFADGVPTQGLDFARLGQLSLPGGNIQSVARNAAYQAADAHGPVTMQHILEAARLEAEKLGRGLTPRELVGWPL